MRNFRVFAVVSTILLALSGCMNQQTLQKRTVTTSGGLVVLELPHEWIVGTEDQDTLLAYPLEEASGALRLSVLVFKSKDDVSAEQVAGADAKKHGVAATLLSNGFWKWEESRSEVEDGVPIQMRFWHLIGEAKGRLYTLLFSWTVDTESAAGARNLGDVKHVQAAILSAKLTE